MNPAGWIEWQSLTLNVHGYNEVNILDADIINLRTENNAVIIITGQIKLWSNITKFCLSSLQTKILTHGQ